MLEIFADGHTRKDEQRVSIGVVAYQNSTLLYSVGALIEAEVKSSMEGEYFAVLYAIADSLERKLKEPAIVINDNNLVVYYLNNVSIAHPHNIPYRQLCEGIVLLAQKLPVTEFRYDIRAKNPRFGEAHKIADNNWNAEPRPVKTLLNCICV